MCEKSGIIYIELHEEKKSLLQTSDLQSLIAS